MRIVQVTPGLIEIPPKTWGAVEKIIWQYKLKMEAAGHVVDIKYLDDVHAGDYDVVHVHMANLALMARDRGLPYVFTCHDHHAYVHGKGSVMYRENLEAMRGARLAIVPAEYLVEYFEGVPVFHPHGVDLEAFKPDPDVFHKAGVICVGNNGLAGDSTFDRKGFGYAIEAVSPDQTVSVYGPSRVNADFFRAHPELRRGNVFLIYDQSDEQLAAAYQRAKVLVHATSVEAGHPPLTILEAMACGTPVIGTFMGEGVLHPGCVVERDVESVRRALAYVQANYEEVRSWYLAKAEEYDWNRVCTALVEKYEAVLGPADPSRRPSMAEQAESLYRRTKRLGIEYFPAKNRVFCTFTDGPKVEIIGGLESTYHVEFVDAPTGQVVHAGDIRNNMWITASRKYYTDWLIRITDVPANETIEYRFDLKNRRAHVIFDTTALGDTIAWVPYVDEFARKHSCRVTCACAHRDLFASEYPGVDFVDINAAPAPDTYARYVINWQPNDRERNPVDVRTVPLQRVASNALGLEFREIRPRIK